MNSNYRSRIILGVLLVALCTLFLLDNYNIISFSFPFQIFDWRNILIIIGVFLLSSARFEPGIILISIGLIGHFPQFWPILLVILGLSIIFKPKFNKGKSHNQPFFNADHTKLNVNEFIDDKSIFGGGQKFIKSESFKGGKITAIFGGSEIDLFDSKLADGINYLEIVCIFGGCTLHIPKEWNVEFDVIPIFGGYSDSRRKIPNLVYNPNSKIIIKGTCVFGGFEIKD